MRTIFAAGISDVIPKLFWNISATVTYLNTSLNELRGNICKSPKHLRAVAIVKSSNKFHGSLPFLNSSLLQYIYLRDDLVSSPAIFSASSTGRRGTAFRP